MLFSIRSAEAPALDKFEGLGKGYRKCHLPVVTQTGLATAIAYVADKTDPLLVPYGWYKDLVVAGAVEHL